jgi:hypothetical protein
VPHEIPGQQGTGDEVPGSQCTYGLHAKKFLEIQPDETQEQRKEDQGQNGMMFMEGINKRKVKKVLYQEEPTRVCG